MKRLFSTCCFILILKTSVSAQPDTIHAKNNKLQLSQLKEGKKAYLVYMTDSAFNRLSSGDIWEREIKFSTKNNQPVVQFNWKWFRNDSLMATIVNVVDKKTFAPITHRSVHKTRGILAYDYTNEYMTPSDTVANNEALKKSKVALTIPIISWEQDLETYPLLPIKKVGQQFDIAFFDPNEKASTYHRYEVIGKEKLELNEDTKVDCWLLKIDYGRGAHGVFWLTEKSKEVLKLKEYFNGRYRFKVRLY